MLTTDADSAPAADWVAATRAQVGDMPLVAGPDRSAERKGTRRRRASGDILRSATSVRRMLILWTGRAAPNASLERRPPAWRSAYRGLSRGRRLPFDWRAGRTPHWSMPPLGGGFGASGAMRPSGWRRRRGALAGRLGGFAAGLAAAEDPRATEPGVAHPEDEAWRLRLAGEGPAVHRRRIARRLAGIVPPADRGSRVRSRRHAATGRHSPRVWSGHLRPVCARSRCQAEP